MKNFLGKCKKVAVVVCASAITAPAFAEGSASGVDTIFAAVDLSKVAGFIATGGVTIVGIALAVKGITIAKRLVSKA